MRSSRKIREYVKYFCRFYNCLKLLYLKFFAKRCSFAGNRKKNFFHPFLPSLGIERIHRFYLYFIFRNKNLDYIFVSPFRITTGLNVAKTIRFICSFSHIIYNIIIYYIFNDNMLINNIKLCTHKSNNEFHRF